MEPTQPSFGDSFTFWKNIILIAVFLLAAPLTLATAIFSLTILSPQNKPKVLASHTSATAPLTKSPGVQVFASLPTNHPTISLNIEAADARPEKVRQYLAFYNSRLEPYAETLVHVADSYQLDFRLLPAIAQQESNLCKFIPEGGHNCWGWGIHSEGTLGFGTFEDAIWTVAKGLREEYIDKGYVTPTEIMSKYTPMSKGSWAAGVTEFMAEME